MYSLDDLREVVRWLLENGADPNKNLEGEEAAGHYTPFHYALGIASYVTTIEIIELLIKYGADVNTYDVCGWTPLHRYPDNKLDVQHTYNAPQVYWKFSPADL